MLRSTFPRLSAALGVAVVIASPFAAAAGPLNPPAGPIAPTHKTLTQVEPRTPLSSATTPGGASYVFLITQPGSYYLTDNLIAAPGKDGGIRIQASNVTVDLNGFALIGGGALQGGIVSSTSPATTNIVVRNGEVSDWMSVGIDLSRSIGTLVEGIVVRDNNNGLRIGATGIARFCSANDNDSVGIEGYQGCVIESCSSFSNGGIGFVVGAGSIVRGCVSRANSGFGFFGIESVVFDHCNALGNNLSGFYTEYSIVDSCVAAGNNSDGIHAEGNCLIRNNLCSSNGIGIRIITSGDCRVEGNTMIDNILGLEVDAAGNIIVRNTCSGNGTNWTIIPGNAVAPIVSASTNGTQINGNTYAGSLGNTDPNANFTY